MIFGIDYHGTFSRDVKSFRLIVTLLQAQGHSCVLVTGIADGDQYAAEVRRDVGELMPVVFAAGSWKRQAARAAGFEVDVWIDDNPEYIAEQDPRKCVGMREQVTPVQMQLPAVPLPEKRKRKPKVAPVTETDLNEREREVMTAIMADPTLSQICRDVPALARDLVGTAAPGVDVPLEVRRAGAWNRNNPQRAWRTNGNRGLSSWIANARPSQAPPQTSLIEPPRQRISTPAPLPQAQPGDSNFLNRLLAKNPEVAKVLGDSDVY